ncbi:MAG TPA: GNAT family N-acetyltransferase [Thermoflexia bacterium]|nr:GNAT family N-acetyltransferase [Thermoflexia bacterium]
MGNNDKVTYCPRCGTAMETAEVSGRMREVCPACGFILYRNPVPGAGVLVEMGGGIVLVKRGQPPFVGWWALPAGYIEADESVEQAAVRECKEETGLDVELLELFGVYSFPEGPGQSGIIIFYRARPVGGELRAGDDAQDVGVFPPDGLPERLAFRTHREVIARWVRSRSPEFRVEMPGVVIREARAEDEARVLELLPLIPANANMSPAEIQAAAQRFRESLAMDVLVAEVDGKVVGLLVLSFVPALSGLRALIDDLAVDPVYRRQGIGAALVEAAVQRADRRGATHLLVDTSRGDPAARDFYQACGFEAGGIAPLRIR